jgi:hypothetical protein
LRAFAVLLGEEQYRSWDDLLETVRTGEKIRDTGPLWNFQSCRRSGDYAAHMEVRAPNRPRVVVETTPILPAGPGDDGKEQWKN